MKRFLKVLLVFILAISFTACGKAEKEKTKVKVYLFEAGGCPYCEEEVNYLESLNGFGTKFEIVRKELYVDHIEWQPGKDYDLGAKVATAFNEKGYTDATYQATPFVIISDTYAASGLNYELEKEINKAYEEGDNDIVGCYIKGDSCSIRKYETEMDKTIDSINKTYTINFIIVYVLIGLIFVYLFITRRKENNVVLKTKESKITKKSTKKK